MAAGLQRFQLGSDAKRLAIVGDVEWLDAETVPRHQPLSSVQIHKRKGVHAVDPGKRARSVCDQRGEQHLGV